MSNEEVLVTPINSVEMTRPGQVEAINNIISAGLLGTANTQNADNTPQEIQNDNSNQITTPKSKSSKRSHKKKLTVAERLARCAITENKIVLDVEPDEEHSKKLKRRRRVRTYESYEEYLAAKLKNHDSQNPDESDIVSKSEFYRSDDDTEEFEEIQTNEKDILDASILEEKDTKRRDIQEEMFEQISHPHILCDIAPNRNCCYDDVSANVERGIPGNLLEKEIEEQEARERKEHEEDLQNFALSQYPESPLATHLSLNFNSDYIRNDFANTALNEPAFNESAFSVSEMNNDLISMSPRSPRGLKMRNVCFTGTFTLLTVQPDDEKVAEYQEQKKDSKYYTHTRRVRTTDKTNEFNESLGPLSGYISNVKLESKSTLAHFTDSEENYKTEEGLSLSQALTEERDIEEEKLKKVENKELQDALDEETNLVIEGRGMSCSGSNLSAEYCDLTIYSDVEKLKLSEDEHLEQEINEEIQAIKEQKAFKEQQKLLRQQEEEQERLDLLKRIEQPDMPPNDVTDNHDGTFDVGIQSVRCNIDDLINRRPSRRYRRRRQETIPHADTDLFAIQPRVLLNIETDRNACYDNINDAIDRGMPGNPLEDELEELEELEKKERLDDIDYYNQQLYNERALKEGLQHSFNSDVLRDEFGNRPPKEESDHDHDIIIEEEEEVNDYASQSDPEPIVPPTEELTTSPRLRRRVKKPVLKTFEVQCELIHATPLEELHPPPNEVVPEQPKEEIPESPKEEMQEPPKEEIQEPQEEPKEETPTNEVDQEPTTRSLDAPEDDKLPFTLGGLGEKMKEVLTVNSSGGDNADEQQDDTNTGVLEKQTNQLNALFQAPPENKEDTPEQPKLEDPIKETLRDLPNPDDNEQQKSITEPLDPINISLNLTNGGNEIPTPDIPEDQKLSTDIVADAVTQDSHPLQDLQMSLLKLNDTNNDTSEVSDTLPKIQMPTDTDSAGLSPRTRSSRLRRSPRYGYRTNEPSSPSMTRLKERAMRLEPIANATNEQLELLIDIIEKDRKQMIREHRFKDNLKCNAAIKHVEGILNKQQIEQNASNPNEQLEIAFDNESRKKEQELLEKQRISRRKLRAKHKKELDDLDKYWNSIQVRKKYNKPSDKLLQMKKQYDAMIAAGNPDDEEEAIKLNEEINQLKQYETEEAHQRMQRDYDSALLHLQKKQQQDFALLQESNNVKMEQFKQERARERRALDFHKENPITNNNDNGLGAQSEELMSDTLGNLFDRSDANKNVNKNDGEKLILPPLDTRRPKQLRYAKPDSS